MYEFAVPFVVSIQRLKRMIIFSIYLCLGGMIKMKKYIKYVIIIVIIILIAIAIYFFSRKNETEDSQVIEYTPQEGVEIDKNQVAYQENVTVDELKADVGATGDNSIYDVTSEYDGRKILTIKPEVQFNVVLAGIIENQMPEEIYSKVESKGAVQTFLKVNTDLIYQIEKINLWNFQMNIVYLS